MKRTLFSFLPLLRRSGGLFHGGERFFKVCLCPLGWWELRYQGYVLTRAFFTGDFLICRVCLSLQARGPGERLWVRVVSGGEICAFNGNRTRNGTSVGGLLNNGNTGLTRVGLVKIPIPPKFAVAASIYARCCRLKRSGIMTLLGGRMRGTVRGVRILVGSGFNSVRGPLLISIHSKTHTSVPNVVSAVLGLKLGSRMIRKLAHGAKGTHFT